jgi:hypothetical protein
MTVNPKILTYEARFLCTAFVSAGSEGVEEEEDGGQGVVEAHAAFLRSAAALAREQWTQFALLPMSIGLIALAALFTWHSRHQWCVAPFSKK